MPLGSYVSSLILGVDDKLFDPNPPAAPTAVRGRSFTICYGGNIEAAPHGLGTSIEYARNLAGGEFDLVNQLRRR